MGAKETTDRQKNLERWSQLEPERCCRLPTHSHGWVVKSFTIIVTDMRPQKTDNALLLGALIEAITARGWKYLVTSRLFNSDNAALGIVDIEADREYRSETDNPADALLSAYIQALENTK